MLPQAWGDCPACPPADGGFEAGLTGQRVGVAYTLWKHISLGVNRVVVDAMLAHWCGQARLLGGGHGGVLERLMSS